MKKLLCVLMFGMVFGQADVTSKIISYDLSINGGDESGHILISELIGYDLERGTIQFVGFNGEIDDYLEITYWGTSDSGEPYNAADFYLSAYNNAATEDAAVSYYFDSKVEYVSFEYQANASYQFNGTLHFIVTAPFPEEDTGYIEEGFDYCIEEGANLIASPCRDAVPILDTLPSEIADNLTGIIGQGVAANNQNGTWMGSLSGLGGGNGYWFKSNVSACFNYNCAEN